MTHFYLGTHRAVWLSQTDVGLAVEYASIANRKRMPRATGAWILKAPIAVSVAEHADVLYRADEGTEGMRWAASLAVPSGRPAHRAGSAAEHFVRLRELAPETPVAPGLEGEDVEDYVFCTSVYSANGVELHEEPVVVVGSLEGRDAKDVAAIVRELVSQGLRLHAADVKLAGIASYAHWCASVDSSGWRRHAGRQPLEGCTHRSCADCLAYALEWRKLVAKKLPLDQLELL